MLSSTFSFPSCLLQRQAAFDTFDGSLLVGFPLPKQKQTLQKLPTGLDSISHGNWLLRPDELSVMSLRISVHRWPFVRDARWCLESVWKVRQRLGSGEKTVLFMRLMAPGQSPYPQSTPGRGGALRARQTARGWRLIEAAPTLQPAQAPSPSPLWRRQWASKCLFIPRFTSLA